MPAGSQLAVGMLVAAPGTPGVARIGQLDGQKVRLDFFDSAATPVASQQWVDESKVRRYVVGVQTRVFWKDADTGRWTAGRVVGGSPPEYFVRRPNADVDLRVAESDLRVRWSRPLTDPLAVLLAGAQESP